MEDEDAVIERMQNLIVGIMMNVEREEQILEELLLDGENGDGLEAVIYDGDAQRAVRLAIEVLLEDLQHFDDEEEFFLEDDRDVLDGHVRAVSIQRFCTLTDPAFGEHFRMNRQTFELLVQEIGNHLVAQNRLHRMRTGLVECVMMAIWILGNLSSFRGTGITFGVSRSVVHFHYLVVIEALRELASKFIKWPSAYERHEMKMAIEERTGYPGAILAMDGTLITVTAPSVQRGRYFDRHDNYSFNVLLVVDKNLLIRQAIVGAAGAAHDSRVFTSSELHNILLERQDIISDDEHILADSAYTLTTQVLVPYRNNGHLTRRQRRFNYVHSSIRMYSERANGLLKEKWRRLYRLQVKNLEYTLDHIMASLVLHNFVLLGGRESYGVQAVAPRVDINPANAPINRQHPLLNAAKRGGVVKRNAIAAALHPAND